MKRKKQRHGQVMNTMRSRYNYGSGKWNQGPNQSTCGRQKRCKHAAFTTKAAQSKERKPATRRNAPEVAIFFQSRMNLSKGSERTTPRSLGSGHSCPDAILERSGGLTWSLRIHMDVSGMLQ